MFLAKEANHVNSQAEAAEIIRSRQRPEPRKLDRVKEVPPHPVLPRPPGFRFRSSRVESILAGSRGRDGCWR